MDAAREPKISNEEIERRLRRGGGRSLAEILIDLEKSSMSESVRASPSSMTFSPIKRGG